MKTGTRIRADVNAGPKELNEDFIRSLPDNGPVVMVNLLRFKGSRLMATAQAGMPTRDTARRFHRS
jgi:hypothetical protein